MSTTTTCTDYVTDLVCGDHCTYVKGKCKDVNESGWTSSCMVPPANTPCNTDCDCGNFGNYGTCNADGKCECGTDLYGTNCEMSCMPTSDDLTKKCGGYASGVCDITQFKCDCINGWSGVNCKVPPDASCTQDSDCGWGGVTGGTCDPNTNTCKCNTGYRGDRCESIQSSVLGDCKSDDDCIQQVCHEGSCSLDGAECVHSSDCKKIACVDNECYSDYSPGSPEWYNIISEMVEEFIEGMATVDGLVNILGVETTKYVIEKLIPKLGTQAIEGLLNNVLKGSIEKAIEKGWIGSLENITETEMSGIVADTMAEQALKLAAEDTINFAVKEVAELLSTLTGMIMSMFNMAQMIGMLLDMTDQAGYSEELNQTYVDLLKTKFYQSYNTNDVLLSLGVRYPYEVDAMSDFQYVQQYMADDTYKNKVLYKAEYIDALKVNSRGKTIIPLYTPKTSVNESIDHTASLLNAMLWGVSGNNETTYQLLKKWWWVELLLLIVILVLLIVPLSIYGVKLHKSKTSTQ